MFYATLFFGLLICSELYLFSVLSSSVTVFEMVYFSLVTGLIGAFWARKEGGTVLKNLVTEVQSGKAPQNSLVEGACVLFGGLLLIAPGFVSDALGLLLIFPLTRAFISKRIQPAIAARNHRSAQQSGVYDQDGYTYGNSDASVHFGKVKLGSGAKPSNPPPKSQESDDSKSDDIESGNTESDKSTQNDSSTRSNDDDIIDVDLDENHTEETSKVKQPHQWDHPAF